MKPNDDDSSRGSRWVIQDVGEIAIKGDEGPPFRCRDSQQAVVRCAGQLLIAGKRDIMASLPK